MALSAMITTVALTFHIFVFQSLAAVALGHMAWSCFAMTIVYELSFRPAFSNHWYDFSISATSAGDTCRAGATPTMMVFPPHTWDIHLAAHHWGPSPGWQL